MASSTVFEYFPGNEGGTYNAATGTAYFVSKFSPQYELLWTSYYGGNGFYQEPWAMAVKNTTAGPEIYVVGQTSNDDQYTTAPPGAYYDSIPALTAQGCIAKYNETGELTWATYFGNGQATINGAAIDANNNLVITGTSNGGLPVPDVQPVGSTYLPHGVASDAFVAQFDEDDGLRWSTYLPGSSLDYGKSIQVLEGGLVVCGNTTSPDFPTVFYGGSAYFRDTLQGVETFVAIFNGADSLVSSTFFDGSGDDATGFGRSALEVDAAGNFFLIGTTTSADLPVEPGGGWANPAPTNGFIVKFLKIVHSIAWMTYLGDSASTLTPTAVICDAVKNIYVVGNTQRDPIVPVELPGMYFQEEPHSVTSDYMQWIGCFVQGFNPQHERVWSTYFDGEEGWEWPTESINAVAWDQDRLYIAGAHGKDLADSSTFFPLFDPGDPAWFDGSFNGLRDAFAASLCTTPLTSVAERSDRNPEAVSAVRTGVDAWTILGLPDGPYRFDLFDTAGRRVLSTALKSLSGRSTEVNTSTCSPAVYNGLLTGPRSVGVRLPVLR